MIVADSEEEDWPFVKLIDLGLVRSVPWGPILPAQHGRVFWVPLSLPVRSRSRRVRWT